MKTVTNFLNLTVYPLLFILCLTSDIAIVLRIPFLILLGVLGSLELLGWLLFAMASADTQSEIKKSYPYIHYCILPSVSFIFMWFSPQVRMLAPVAFLLMAIWRTMLFVGDKKARLAKQ